MKNLQSFYGILILISVIVICQLIGNIFGPGLYTGVFLLTAAFGVMATLIYNLSKDR